MRCGRLILAVLGALWLTLGVALAYDEAIVAAVERAVSRLSLDLKTVETGVGQPGASDEQLSQFRDQVEDIRTKAVQQTGSLAGPIDEVSQQIGQLGPPPAGNSPEAESLAAQRKLLNDELSRLLGPKSQLDLIVVGAEQLSGRISSIQRDEFVKRIFEGNRSVFNPYLWYDTGLGLGLLYTRIDGLLRNWWAEAGKTVSLLGLSLIPVYLLVFLAGFLLIRRVIVRWATVHGGASRTPNEIGRLWRVARGMVVTFAALVVLLAPIYLSFENIGLMTPRFALIFNALSAVFFVTVFNYMLARLVAAPGEVAWRLVNIDDKAAARLPLLAGIATFVSIGNENLIKVADALYLPVAYTVGHAALAALLILILLSLMILVLRNQAGITVQLGGRRTYLNWARNFAFLMWLLIALGFAALAFGYLSFANYLAQNLLKTSFLLVALVLLHHLSDAAVSESFYPQSSFGRVLRSMTGLGERAIERVGLLFRTLVDILLLLAGLPALLAFWTVTWVDFRSLMNTVAQGLRIGEFTLSPWAFVIGIMILTVGVILTKLVIRWFDKRILSESRIDKGVQDSLRTGASYAGYALAFIVALTAGGVQFSNLFIIAGALGVGIGFGLQSIVNNFVSGLILLVERPIRVGDWVALDAGEGLVKRINVRSTEIESFDACSIIVPNSSLVTGVVRNWTHGDTMGRFAVAVTVDYGSDSEAVRDLLLNTAKAHPKVLTFPEPMVLLLRFGPYGLDFEIKASVADIFEGGIVASDLRHEILRLFREKGITIPHAVALIQTAQK